jgi:hypothetical protein
VINKTGEHETSRFSRMEIPRMHRFSDRAGPANNSHNAADRVAFRNTKNVGTPEDIISRLNSPAYVYPCQRFANALTNANA